MLKIGDSEVVDLQTVSRHLKITVPTLKRYVAEGVLPAEESYGKIWVKKDTLKDFRRKGKSRLRKKAYLKRKIQGVAGNALDIKT